MKTGQQIENDIYTMLEGSVLAAEISGKVYKFGLRPKDSVTEDAVVKFVEGEGVQVVNGTVVVNIYIPDIDPYNDGMYVRDVLRCEQVEAKAGEWVEALTADKSNYLFRIAQTIYTEDEPLIKQHFVSVRLKFNLLN